MKIKVIILFILFTIILWFVTGCSENSKNNDEVKSISLKEVAETELETYKDLALGLETVNEYELIDKENIKLNYKNENLNLTVTLRLGYGEDVDSINIDKITAGFFTYIFNIKLDTEDSKIKEDFKSILKTKYPELIYTLNEANGIEAIIDTTNSEKIISNLKYQAELETKIKNGKINEKEVKQMLKDGTIIKY